MLKFRIRPDPDRLGAARRPARQTHLENAGSDRHRDIAEHFSAVSPVVAEEFLGACRTTRAALPDAVNTHATRVSSLATLLTCSARSSPAFRNRRGSPCRRRDLVTTPRVRVVAITAGFRPTSVPERRARSSIQRHRERNAVRGGCERRISGIPGGSFCARDVRGMGAGFGVLSVVVTAAVGGSDRRSCALSRLTRKRPEGVGQSDAAEGHEYSTLIVTSALTWK